MKLLLVTLAAIIAISANAVEANDNLSEADLENIGEQLLQQVKNLKQEVQQIQDEVRHAIHKKIKQIPEVAKITNQYLRGLETKTLKVECAVSIDMHYWETLENISAGILKKSLKNVTNDEDKLKTTEKELESLQTILEENLDEEVKKCINDSKTCKITGEFINSTDDLFRFVGLTKHKIINHAENEVSSEEVQGQVKEYIATVPKCLDEQVQ